MWSIQSSNVVVALLYFYHTKREKHCWRTMVQCPKVSHVFPAGQSITILNIPPKSGQELLPIAYDTDYCCVQIRADLGHITSELSQETGSLVQLSSGEQAMMPMPDLVDQQYHHRHIFLPRGPCTFSLCMRPTSASWYGLPTSSLHTPKPPPPPDALEALVIADKDGKLDFSKDL